MDVGRRTDARESSRANVAKKSPFALLPPPPPSSTFCLFAPARSLWTATFQRVCTFLLPEVNEDIKERTGRGEEGNVCPFGIESAFSISHQEMRKDDMSSLRIRFVPTNGVRDLVDDIASGS